MTAANQPKTRLRGHTGIRVGSILAIVGLLALIAGVIVIATQSLSKVNNFQRVSFSQQTGTITFSKPGGYVAYYEAPGVNSSISRVPPILRDAQPQPRARQVAHVVRQPDDGNKS